MGITIHYEGSVDNKETIKEVLGYTKFFCDNIGWETKKVMKEGKGYYSKVYNQNNEVEHKWLKFSEEGKYEEIGKEEEESVKIGLVLNPNKNTNFNTEWFEISFFKYEDKWHLRDFCKTQVFSEEERPNLIAHQIIITLLKTIKNSWIENMEIKDEGDYLIPFSKEERKEYAKESIREGYREEFVDKKPFNFNELVKSHTGNLKVIKNVGKSLFDMGFDLQSKNVRIKHKDENG